MRKILLLFAVLFSSCVVRPPIMHGQALPVPNAILQYFDNNGNPLAGGLLYSYISNTLTPKATYTSSTGLVPNTQPLVLDSSGRGNVWLGGGVYRLVLKTSAGVLIKDVSGVTSTSFISGTLNRIPKFTDTNSIGDSSATDNGTVFNIGEKFSVINGSSPTAYLESTTGVAAVDVFASNGSIPVQVMNISASHAGADPRLITIGFDPANGQSLIQLRSDGPVFQVFDANSVSEIARFTSGTGTPIISMFGGNDRLLNIAADNVAGDNRILLGTGNSANQIIVSNTPPSFEVNLFGVGSVFSVVATSSATDANIYIYHNATVKLVHVGAADSCTAGFRCLRVAN